jgi:ketosteroid isomerase-like protein
LITSPGDNLRDDGERYAALVGRFGEGWEKLSSKLMGAIFTDDAVFVPDAFGVPIRGRTGIEEYWDDIPYEQSEVAFRAGEIHVAGPWFAVEFKCTFRRRRTGDSVDVRGAMFCETEGDLIAEMRMYWDRRLGR